MWRWWWHPPSGSKQDYEYGKVAIHCWNWNFIVQQVAITSPGLMALHVMYIQVVLSLCSWSLSYTLLCMHAPIRFYKILPLVFGYIEVIVMLFMVCPKSMYIVTHNGHCIWCDSIIQRWTLPQSRVNTYLHSKFLYCACNVYTDMRSDMLYLWM